MPRASPIREKAGHGIGKGIPESSREEEHAHHRCPPAASDREEHVLIHLGGDAQPDWKREDYNAEGRRIYLSKATKKAMASEEAPAAPEATEATDAPQGEERA